MVDRPTDRRTAHAQGHSRLHSHGEQHRRRRLASLVTGRAGGGGDLGRGRQDGAAARRRERDVEGIRQALRRVAAAPCVRVVVASPDAFWRGREPEGARAELAGGVQRIVQGWDGEEDVAAGKQERGCIGAGDGDPAADAFALAEGGA